MKKISNALFYKKAIEEYGISAQGVHWNSKHTQYKRFEIITKLIKKDISSSNIIDVGCGFGEYYKYLKINNKLPKKYEGIDCEDDMIQTAKKRFPSSYFYKKNVLIDSLENADYYVCSGALNILDKKDFFLFITRCFKASNKGFIFNFLKLDSFNNLTINEVLNFCHNLTTNIQTKDSYLNNDFTVLLLH